MNAFGVVFLFGVAVLACLVQGGILPSNEEETLKCFSCRSGSDGPCHDPLGTGVTDTVECVGAYPTCYTNIESWSNLTEEERGCLPYHGCPEVGDVAFYCEKCWGGDLCNRNSYTIIDDVAKIVNNDNDQSNGNVSYDYGY